MRSCSRLPRPPRVAFAFVLALLAAPPAGAQPAPSSWPMFRGGPARRGLAAAPSIPDPPQVDWIYDSQDSIDQSSPAIGVVLEYGRSFLAPAPRGQAHAEPAEHDHEQRRHDAESEEQFEEGEAPIPAVHQRTRFWGVGLPGASVTARRLASSSVRLLPQCTTTERE